MSVRDLGFSQGLGSQSGVGVQSETGGLSGPGVLGPGFNCFFSEVIPLTDDNDDSLVLELLGVRGWGGTPSVTAIFIFPLPQAQHLESKLLPGKPLRALVCPLCYLFGS